MISSPPAEQHRKHCTLCVLVHGLGGSKDDYLAWVDELRTQRPDWTIRALETLRSDAAPLRKSVDVVADKVATEILDILKCIQAEGDVRITLHCVGHSMGGLLLRGAFPRVFAEQPHIHAGVFMSLSTPHLGVQASWGAPETMWRNLSIITAPFSKQLVQLAIQDNLSGRRLVRGTSGDAGYVRSASGELESSPHLSADGQENSGRIPYLVEIADACGPEVACLSKFQTRICVAMADADPVVPTPSASLWPDRCWKPAEQLPDDCIAGWGYEAESVHSPEDTTPGFTQTPRQAGGINWKRCADRACYYPEQILEGLHCISWFRLVVRMKMARCTPHVFLIAKQVEQTALEHALARECIRDLVGVLVSSSQPPAGTFASPRWIRTVQATATSRDSCAGRWAVALEGTSFHVKYYAFHDELEATFFFDGLGATSRLLFDAEGQVKKRAGANVPAFQTIANQFALPSAANVSGKWVVVSEEGLGNIKIYPADTEEHARNIFDSFGFTSRVLFDPARREVNRGGWNWLAQRTITKFFRRDIGDVLEA
eukprot:TRINITY_DN106343_c0_g1_i1.p1 TRINITY_DN106343_c0_g1~~TRINITY_DN106343_c0_g1_i1.p1  ORF type:complete len:543 (+),score=37.88 TRINITY_DN106343_c0_g1_i1:51-1679(+)